MEKNEWAIDELPSDVKNFLKNKVYGSDLFLTCLKDINKTPIIHRRKSRKKVVNYDKLKYSRRHEVENLFCNLKQFRLIATRYEKLDIKFLSIVTLGCALFWDKL